MLARPILRRSLNFQEIAFGIKLISEASKGKNVDPFRQTIEIKRIHEFGTGDFYIWVMSNASKGNDNDRYLIIYIRWDNEKGLFTRDSWFVDKDGFAIPMPRKGLEKLRNEIDYCNIDENSPPRFRRFVSCVVRLIDEPTRELEEQVSSMIPDIEDTHITSPLVLAVLDYISR